jgi:hypothetical protein
VDGIELPVADAPQIVALLQGRQDLGGHADFAAVAVVAVPVGYPEAAV